MTQRTPAVLTHSLKTHPGWFGELWSGHKRFEIRRDDRGFQVGDILLLKEWAPEGETFTGRRIAAIVHNIWRGLPGVNPAYVVMAIEPYMRADNLFDNEV